MPRGIDSVDQARLEGRLWTPQVIQSSVGLWLDAADLSTLQASSGSVTQWSDKGLKGGHATPTATGRNPLLKSQVQNGLTVLKFDGTDDGVSGAFNFTLSAESVFLAFNCFGSTGIADRYFTQSNDEIDWQTSGGLLPAYRTSSSTIGSKTPGGTAGSISFSSGLIIYGLVVGSIGKLYKNGVFQTTITESLSNKTFTRYAIGVSPLADNNPPVENINSDYFEAIILSVEASDDIRQKVEGYLAWKWGLRSLLPGNHPYINKSPSL